MKKLWEQLKPQERRWLIAIGCVVFITLNYFMVWPKFKDWTANSNRIAAAKDKLAKYSAEIARKDDYQRRIASLDVENNTISPDDQAVHFENTFRDHALENGVSIQSVSRPSTRTDDFTMEQQATLQVLTGEKNLVNFLYSLGSGGSLMRVKSMSLRPADNNRYQLHADLTIAESYLRTTPGAPVKNPTPAKPAAPAIAPAVKPAVVPPTAANPAKTSPKPLPLKH